MLIKGAGGQGSELDFHFFYFSEIVECQLPGTIFGMKKYCSLPKLSQF